MHSEILSSPHPMGPVGYFGNLPKLSHWLWDPLVLFALCFVPISSLLSTNSFYSSALRIKSMKGFSIQCNRHLTSNFSLVLTFRKVPPALSVPIKRPANNSFRLPLKVLLPPTIISNWASPEIAVFSSYPCTLVLVQVECFFPTISPG